MAELSQTTAPSHTITSCRPLEQNAVMAGASHTTMRAAVLGMAVLVSWLALAQPVEQWSFLHPLERACMPVDAVFRGARTPEGVLEYYLARGEGARLRINRRAASELNPEAGTVAELVDPPTGAHHLFFSNPLACLGALNSAFGR